MVTRCLSNNITIASITLPLVDLFCIARDFVLVNTEKVLKVARIVDKDRRLTPRRALSLILAHLTCRGAGIEITL